MNATEQQQLAKLRTALQRHGVKINSKSSAERCHQEVERITGARLSNVPSMLSQQLTAFISRGLYDDLPRRAFTPLKNYTSELDRFRALAEMTR